MKEFPKPLAMIAVIGAFVTQVSVADVLPDTKVRLGMTKEEVRKLFPAAKEVEVIPIKGNKDLTGLEVESFEWLDRKFKIRMIFGKEDLRQIEFNNFDHQKFGDIEKLAEKVSGELSKQYGKPEKTSQYLITSKVLIYSWSKDHEGIQVSGLSSGPTEELSQTSFGLTYFRK